MVNILFFTGSGSYPRGGNPACRQAGDEKIQKDLKQPKKSLRTVDKEGRIKISHISRWFAHVFYPQCTVYYIAYG